MTTRRRKYKHWRNLLLAVIVAVLCFGGSFTCSTDDDDDHFNGSVNTNTRQDAPRRHQ
jgi:hypothetical protein